MSKAAKQSIFILIGLVLLSLAATGFFLNEKSKLEASNQNLQQELVQVQDREKKKIAELNEQIKKLGAEKADLERRWQQAQQELDDSKKELAVVQSERAKWDQQIERIRQERNELMAKLQELNQKSASFQDLAPEVIETPKVTPTPETSQVEIVTTEPPVQELPAESDEIVKKDEESFAAVLKEKASLQVKLDALKDNLNKSAEEIVELKQKNADLQIQIDAISHDKEDLAREINFKADLVNNLSLELARAKNDKKMVGDRIAKLNDENIELRNQMKKLVSTKGALEKSVVRLTQDKSKMEKEMGQTETIIQSKIDEIWEIKDSLDQTIKSASKKPTKNNEVELPPIVVSSQGSEMGIAMSETTTGLNGKVVSINTDNNFIIVDIGEAAGVRLGDVLSVYRDSKYIARLEVIQVRKDICAADIKDQWAKIQVGDTVR